MYRLPGTGPELNCAKIEANANKHLHVLHKRLGYIKVDVLQKIQAGFEATRKRYDDMVQEQEERHLRIREEKFKHHKRASLIMMRRKAEQKRQAERDAAALKAVMSKRRSSIQEDEPK